MHDAYIRAIITALLERKPKKDDVSRIKQDLAKQYGAAALPTDITVLMHATQEEYALLKNVLTTKPTRTISGVTVVAIMCRPDNCPHGRCIMCPGGTGSAFGDVPQSYTGKEPATLRAIRNRYDPYLQIMNRLEQYIVLGQSPQKVELIIMGGTFPAYDKDYRDKFIIMCYQAMNDFSQQFFDMQGNLLLEKFKTFFELPGSVGDGDRTTRIHQKLLLLKEARQALLEEEQHSNERAFIKCIGLTIETRPDWGRLAVGNDLLQYGCTRVEVGIQSIYNNVLHAINRGHTDEESRHCLQELKDLGFKINVHYMPGLPGLAENGQKDIAGMKALFENPAYRPDMLKLYPCMVMPGTPLYEQFKRGQYTPIDAREAALRIAELKCIVPRYCRIMRIQRDIPTYRTVAGVEKTNLRQDVDALMRDHGWTCQCIRCREIKGKKISGAWQFEIIPYDASDGKELFISIKDEKDRLLGFARMRYPSAALRPEITEKSALIRELHVYGSAVTLGTQGGEKETQHKGFGKMLMEKAEELACRDGKEKMIIISGVGVRAYYRKLGYTLEGPYMTKFMSREDL
ncbi:MAG: tRNA uridine(34) 5-carboxymethylaminomethyl modification radical SAM/GNAT enzyme Elp3 [archaeon]